MNNPAIEWEYLVGTMFEDGYESANSPRDIKAMLETKGKEGWELIHYSPLQWPGFYIFKRPKGNQGEQH
jgi:hypothetical protein